MLTWGWLIRKKLLPLLPAVMYDDIMTQAKAMWLTTGKHEFDRGEVWYLWLPCLIDGFVEISSQDARISTLLLHWPCREWCEVLWWVRLSVCLSSCWLKPNTACSWNAVIISSNANSAHRAFQLHLQLTNWRRVTDDIYTLNIMTDTDSLCVTSNCYFLKVILCQ